MNFDEFLKEKLKRMALKHKFKRSEAFMPIDLTLNDLDTQNWNKLIKKEKEIPTHRVVNLPEEVENE